MIGGFGVQRAGELDWLRALAALTVVAIHVTGSYVSFLSAAYYANHVARFAVPLFIIISGFALQYSSGRKTVYPLPFYQRRLDRILWPYLLWTLFYILLVPFLLGQGLPHVSWRDAGRHLLWGTGSYHLYFLPIIIQLYLLFPILSRWVHKQPLVMLLSSLLISLAAVSVFYLGMLQQSPWWLEYKMLYTRAFPPWLFYFILGMAAVEWKGRLDILCRRFVIPLGILWGCSLYLIILDTQMSGIGTSILRPSVLVYASMSFLFFYGVFRYLPGKVSAVRWLSEQSFIIYLMHPAVLSLLAYWVPRMVNQRFWYDVSGMSMLYVVTLGITLAGCLVVSWMPFARYLGGVNRRG